MKQIEKIINMKFIFILGISIFLPIVLTSCKDARSNKKIIDTIRKEYKALNNNNGAKYRYRYETAKRHVENSYNYRICLTCNGYGILYSVDLYGNPIVDYYGNFQFTGCHNCNGYGYTAY